MATTFLVPDGRVAMNVVLRNGFGTSGGSITSLNFQPDFIWEKRRNVAVSNHFLVDSVRGASKTINSDLTAVEATYPTYFTSFNSNGYSLGVGDYTSADSLVDWCWKAGGTAVSNTSGTITSQVSANTTAGFSVVTYTGTGASASMGHGLGAVPSMIIIKKRSAARSWIVWHTSFGTSLSSSASSFMYLDSSNALGGSGTANFWANTAPTSTLLVVGVDNSDVSATYVAYCWAPVAGYSAFGSYTGNGSADGPFVYTGFRPRWIMFKRTDAAYVWGLLDTARDPVNIASQWLYPGANNMEFTYSSFDFLSNGFKLRATDGAMNASGGTYIYAAFAENPLKYSNAR